MDLHSRSLGLGSSGFLLLLGSFEIDIRSSDNLLDWSLSLNESSLLGKRSSVGLIDIVPVAADWVGVAWADALDWWSVGHGRFQLDLGTVDIVWSLGVVVAWGGVS